MTKLENDMDLRDIITTMFNDLYPINRSITGKGVEETLDYIISHYIPSAKVETVSCGERVFDWTVPDVWDISDGYILNSEGKKIVDYKQSNLHVVSYSQPVNKIVDKDELIQHLHTLPEFPNRIPYRTSYYTKTWGFCCQHSLLESDSFKPPFKVVIESKLQSSGELKWLECLHEGKNKEEILISTYCCHPSLANDNLSGIILAVLLFQYISNIETRYSYRLLIAPETIGTIAFLSKQNTEKIVAGMIATCVAGPDKISIKNGFDTEHFINVSAHLALQRHHGTNYITYPFTPDGSDERQFSSPGFRIVTPSIHKSKYYEFDEYHTSADSLDFVSPEALIETLKVYKSWISLVESNCYPKRTEMFCEFQLGKRGLYPSIGGTLNQLAHSENKYGSQERLFTQLDSVSVSGAHMDAFNWLMHLADGTISNFDISKKSGIDILTLNEAIALMADRDILEI